MLGKGTRDLAWVRDRNLARVRDWDLARVRDRVLAQVRDAGPGPGCFTGPYNIII